MGLPKNKLPVIEEFISFQGEGLNMGVPYRFIRVGGCPLRCNFCDTERSWQVRKDSIQHLDDVIDRALADCAKYNIDWISITGGEPLIYPEQVKSMIKEFKEASINVHIETSGRFYDSDVHDLCDLYSVDAKTPCTGESMPGFFKGIENIRYCDQVKCLIWDRLDLGYAWELNKRLDGKVPMILQPFNTNILTDSTKNMRDDFKDMIGRNQKVIGGLDRDCVRARLLDAYLVLYRMWKKSCDDGSEWKSVIISPQLHVLTFGNIPNT